ncbi:hypothetical protein ACJ41O_008939 [Fusarium nematophilum]
MEILGALASSIAIAQAIAAGRHMVNLIRDIPEMQNEFDDWLQEIDLISVMVSEARNISSSTLGKSLILRAAQRLQEINDILQTIVSMCSKETQSKVKKRKWMLQTTKMQQLRVKAMDAKMNLHFALTCQHPDLMRQQVRSELQQQFQAFALHLSNHFGPENGNQRVLSVAFEVNTALRYQNDLTEIEVDILQRTRSWADGADDMTQTAICQAIDQGHAIDAIQETLHDEPLAINTLNLWGRAALHIAILEDRPDVVKLLISEHADVNIRDFLGQTPLMDAAQNERLECMRLLIQADCGLNQQSNNGSTALHFAVRGGRYRAVSLLLAAGASTRERDLWGRTPLHDLVWVDDPDTIERMLPLLLINKDHLEMRDGMGRTTVMEAILQLNIPLLRCLIQEQASLSTKDSNSYNMLHFAAGRATLEMMRYLISLNLSGIDTDCMNTNGYTPWETFMCNQFGLSS